MSRPPLMPAYDFVVPTPLFTTSGDDVTTTSVGFSVSAFRILTVNNSAEVYMHLKTTYSGIFFFTSVSMMYLYNFSNTRSIASFEI